MHCISKIRETTGHHVSIQCNLMAVLPVQDNPWWFALSKSRHPVAITYLDTNIIQCHLLAWLGCYRN
jgi:hypothetical protein